MELEYAASGMKARPVHASRGRVRRPFCQGIKPVALFMDSDILSGNWSRGIIHKSIRWVTQAKPRQLSKVV